MSVAGSTRFTQFENVAFDAAMIGVQTGTSCHDLQCCMHGTWVCVGSTLVYSHAEDSQQDSTTSLCILLHAGICEPLSS